MLSHAKTVILFAIGIAPNAQAAFNAQPVAARQWLGAAMTFSGVVWYLMVLESGGRARLHSLQPSHKTTRNLKDK
jgi:hypothetical protein